MATGLPGADSLALVTSEIGGQNLVALATALFGQAPAVWGRYFTSPATTKAGEYRHLNENQLLHNNNIRVIPIARQTDRVAGSEDDGSADATDNVDDLLATFGAEYLASQGGEVVMFLDVEPEVPLSLAYYRGWATMLVSHSRDASNGQVIVRPCVYLNHGDQSTCNVLNSAVAAEIEMHGVWVARYVVDGCNALRDFNDGTVRPQSLAADIPILLWQYSDDCHGRDGFDCNQTNPEPSLQQDLLSRCVLPPAPLVA